MAPTSTTDVASDRTGAAADPVNVVTTPEGTSSQNPTTIFDDVVTLDSKTGADLDTGQNKKLYRQNADADLFLDWGGILYTSARHATTYNDSNGGTEDGAYERCQSYRLDGRPSADHLSIGGGNQQYCFTTSNGHPAWLEVINELPNGGLLLKVAVWRQ